MKLWTVECSDCGKFPLNDMSLVNWSEINETKFLETLCIYCERPIIEEMKVV